MDTVTFVIHYVDLLARIIGWLILIAGLVLQVVNTSKIGIRNGSEYWLIILGFGFCVLDRTQREESISLLRAAEFPIFTTKRYAIAPIIPRIISRIFRKLKRKPTPSALL